MNTSQTNNKHQIKDYFKGEPAIFSEHSDFQLLLRMAACALALGVVILIMS